MRLEGESVLVTGANRGIGAALVNALLGKGVRKVYAAARNPDSLPDFGDSRVVPIAIDITNTEQVKQAAKTAADVELLINNAGVAAFTSLLDGPIDLIKRDMDTNYYGTLDMVRRFVPVLETKTDAAIVNVVTIGAFVNFPMLGGYCTSKSALFSLSQGIRIELAAKSIAIHTVNPGPIDTDMAKDFQAEKTSPEVTAENTLTALESGEVDIFPDAGSQGMIKVWKSDYRALEQMVAEMHNAT